MKAADWCGPAIAIAGAIVFGGAILASPGRAAEPSPANQAPVQQLDVWRLVVCAAFPPKRGQCQLVEEVGPLPLGACQDLARGAQRVLPPPASPGCVVDVDALATARGW